MSATKEREFHDPELTAKAGLEVLRREKTITGIGRKHGPVLLYPPVRTRLTKPAMKSRVSSGNSRWGIWPHASSSCGVA